MTSPEFVTEMTAQLSAARRQLREATDSDVAALAAARLADLTDLARRHGVDIGHIQGLAAEPA